MSHSIRGEEEAPIGEDFDQKQPSHIVPNLDRIGSQTTPTYSAGPQAVYDACRPL